MNKNEIPIVVETKERWNELFQIRIFHDGNASPSMINFFSKYKDEVKGGNYLDLGGAQGAHSIYALEQGMKFAVSIDFSTVGTKQFETWAQKEGYKNQFESICQDLIKFNEKKLNKKWESNFSLVSALFVLYNFKEDIWKGLIYKMQQCTQVGGFNVLVVPKSEPSTKKRLKYIFQNNEIDLLYNTPIVGRWEIDNDLELFPRNKSGRFLGGDIDSKIDLLVYKRVG